MSRTILSPRRVSRAAGPCALALLLAATAGAAAAQEAARAGVAGAVRGEVTLLATRPDVQVGRAVASGQPIFLGDRIETGARSGLQILLLDETVFTIGPNAAIVIDQFVYDPEKGAGRVAASVVKGAFRFVTGKVARNEPEAMTIALPVGTIGIRGTAGAGQVVELAGVADRNDTLLAAGFDPATVPAGTDIVADVVLLGPGPSNDANERIGRLVFTGADATPPVEITRGGYGVRVVGLGGPAQLQQFTPQHVAQITGGLAPGRGDAVTPGGDGPPRPANQDQPNQPGGPGGQGAAGDGQGAANAQTGTGPRPQGPAQPAAVGPAGPGPGVPGLGQLAALTGQDLGAAAVRAIGIAAVGDVQRRGNTAAERLASNVGRSLGTTASWNDIRSLQTGTGTYTLNDVALTYVSGTSTNSAGEFDATATFNFGARTVSLNVTINYGFAVPPNPTNPNAANVTFNDPTSSFANDVGLAQTVMASNSTAHASKFTTIPTGDVIKIEPRILNNVDAGIIASAAEVRVTVQHVNGTIISGTGTAPRN
ncbi:MAG: FecR domain-containing protein [Alphaproteobacteria bacterium]